MKIIRRSLTRRLGLIGLLISVPLAEINASTTFIAAKKAINRGQWQDFHQLKDQLGQHPLLPYLNYYQLNKQFSAVDDSEIEQYINKHPNSPMAAKLRRKCIKEAASNNDWQKIIQLYKPSSIKTYQCYYYHAMLKQNNINQVTKDVNALWLTGRELPSSCNQMFTDWLTQSPKRSELLWARFELALGRYNFKLAKQLLSQMSAQKALHAKAILHLYKAPHLVTRSSYLKRQSSPEVISYGLFRLARRNPELAINTWKRLKSRYRFNDKQQQRIFQAIALRFALRKNKRSGHWFRKVVGKSLPPVYQEWMIRSALIQRDWQLVKEGIEGMPTSQQQSSRWQYWRARAMAKLGMKQEAQKAFASLSKKRDYHGFLAAQHFDKELVVKHHVPNLTQDDMSRVKALPAFMRAKLLFKLKQHHEARLELYYLMKHCDEKQQYIITKLVADWGWDTQALHLTRYAEHKDDITLRFPLHYHDTVIKHAKKRQIPPELIYAIIRQESFFTPKATSHAGARGLMQLMPATAYRTSKQYKLPYNKKALYNGKANIQLGSAHLNHLHKKLRNHPILVIAAYNAGRNAVNRWLPKTQKMPADIWIETIPFYETRKYVRHVIAYFVVYQQRLGKSPNINVLMKSI